MNKTFHSVWNASKQAYVAAAETVSAKGKPSSGVKIAAVVASLLGGLLGSAAQAAPPLPNQLPTGGQLSAGSASIGQSGANMVIHQSTDRAAIHWQTFNVGSNAQVQFNQPSASSVTLNRVMSSDPSQIFGRITANGQVILTNTSGVYFGPSARVDVGGLVATTHGISNADFMAGSNKFDRQGSTASVVNEGELKASLGGYIALLAPEVRNQGAVIAQMGTVALASGEAIDLKFDSNNRLTSLRVEPSQIAALVDNRHAVQAPGGLVIISAQSMDRLAGGVVNNSGAIEANGLQQQGGRIILSASHKVLNSGSIRANASAPDSAGNNGGPAGRIEISAPDVLNTGSISASGAAQTAAGVSAGSVLIQATQFTQSASGSMDLSAPQQGGTLSIQATGKVLLQGQVNVSATQDAPGHTSQGGQIDVAAQGDIDVNNAALDASGGHGGRIQLRAAADPQPGQPSPLPDAPGQGRLAIMGNSTLSVRGRQGQGGQTTLLGEQIELFDHIAIDASGASGGGTVLVGGDWQGSNGVYQATTVTLQQGAVIDASATQQGDGGKVVLWSDIHNADSSTQIGGTITAKGAGNGAGGQVETSGHTLGVADSAVINTRGGLWLLDPASITIDGGNGGIGGTTVGASVIASALGSNSVTLQSDTSITIANNITGVAANANTLTLQAGTTISQNTNVAVNTNGGSVTYISNSGTSSGGGIYLASGSSITTGGGSISLGTSSNYAIGAVGDGTNGYSGVFVAGSLNAGAGAVSIYGTSKYTSGSSGIGVYVGSSITGGNITIIGNGSSSNTNHYNYGVYITSSIAASGTLSITGTGGGSGGAVEGRGLYLKGATVSTTTGNIYLIGNGSTSGNSGSHGLAVSKGSSVSSTLGGDISITGTGGSGLSSFGVVMDDPGIDTISTTGSGNITITGTGGTGTTSVSGIFLGATSAMNISTVDGSLTLIGTKGSSGTGYGIETWNGAVNLGNSSQAGNIILSADTFNFGYATSLNTSDAVTIDSTSASFSSALTYPLTNLSLDSRISGLTIGKSTNTADITIASATTIAGPISVYGGDIYLNASLDTKNGGIAGDVLLKASGNIIQAASTTVNTAGGDVAYWSNSDGETTNGGSIHIKNGVTIDTRTLSDRTANDGTSNDQNGGAITLGGGSAGATAPSGYAYSKTASIGGIFLGTSGGSAISLSSGGGDIALRGQANAAGESNGISTYGGFTIDGGKTGNITLDGQGQNGSYNAGIYTSYQISAGNNVIKTVNGDISITGNSNGGGSSGDRGVLLIAGSSYSTTIEATGTGTITVNGGSGIGAHAYSGIYTNNIYTLGVVNILAHSGTVNVTGTGNGGFQSDSNALTIGYKPSGDVTTSSSNVAIKDDKVTWSNGGSWQINTSGATTIQPYGNDFATALSTANIGFGTNTLALTIGKASSADGTSDVDVTIANAISVAGAISVYSGNINVNANLTSTASNSEISLQATKVVTQAANVAVNTNGGSVTYISNYGNNTTSATGGIYLASGSSITTGGGAISLGASNNYAIGAVTGGSGIFLAGTVNAGSGNVSFYGQSTYTAGVDGIGVHVSSGSAITGNNVLIIGVGSQSNTNSSNYGVALDGSVLTASGNLSVTGTGGGSSSGYLANRGIETNGTTLRTTGAGAITLTGTVGYGTEGSNYNYALEIANTNITSATGQVAFYGNSIDCFGPTTVTTSGAVTIAPLGTSFSSALTYPLTNLSLASSVSGLTIGKSTNTADITIGSATSIAGPITVYGGNINVNAGLETTNATTGDITLTGNVSGSGNIALANNRVLTITESGTSTYSGVISGTGASFVKAGAGTLTLSGANTYAGNTTISAGSLLIGVGGSLGTSGTYAGNISNAGTFSYNASSTQTLSGVISGAGSLVVNGSGTLALAAANTYTGATTITSGTLQLNSGGTINSSSSITDNGTLAYNNATVNTANLVTGSGSISVGAVSGTGTTLQLTGTLGVTGALTVYSGNVLDLNGHSSPNAISMAGTGIGNGGVLINSSSTPATQSGAVTLTADSSVGGSGNLTISGAIGGAMGGAYGLTKVGSHTVTLSGTNTYTGTTTISAGTLQLGGGGTSGSVASSSIVDNAGLVFNRSDNLTFSGVISGTGSVDQAGSGTLTFTGSNSYTGTTTLSAGTLQLGAGGTSGSIASSSVVDNGVLRFNRSDNVTFSGVISGSGSVGQSGAGTQTLSGANTYAGGTTVSAGTLKAAHASALGTGAVTVNSYSMVDVNGHSLGNDWRISGQGVYPGNFGWAAIGNSANADVSLAGSITLLGDANVGSFGSGTLTLNGTLDGAYQFSVYTAGKAYTQNGRVGGGTAPTGYSVATVNRAVNGTVISSGNVSLNAAVTVNGNILITGNDIAFTQDLSMTKSTGGSISLTAADKVLGTGNIYLAGLSSLSWEQANDSVYGGTIQGASANLIKVGLGQLTLTGANVYNQTYVSDGPLQIGNGGTTGQLGTGDVLVDNVQALLRFNRSDAITVGNNISGLGSVSQASSNSLTLTGVAAYTGITVVASGRLVMQNDALPATSAFLGEGTVAIEPASSAFSGPLYSSAYAFDTTLTGLRLGKNGMGSDVALDSPITINGPISVYGSQISVDGNLSSTASGAGILLKASGDIVQAGGVANASVSVTTSGGDIVYWANAAGGGGSIVLGPMLNGSTVALASAGGRIVLAGGLDNGANGGTAGDNIPDNAAGGGSVGGGVLIGGVGTINAGSGDIVIRGNGTGTGLSGFGISFYETTSKTLTGGNITLAGSNAYTGTGLQGWGTLLNNTSINASGQVSLQGSGATGVASDNNVGLYLLSSTISSSNGSISLVGTGGTGTSQSSSQGIYSSGTSMGTGNGGTISLTGTGGGNSQGVYVAAGTIGNSVATGDITVVGTGGGSADGIYLAASVGRVGYSHAITLQTDSLTLNSAMLRSTGALNIQTRTASTQIGVGTTVAGGLNLASTLFSSNAADGFSVINIGSNTGTGNITLANLPARDNVVVQSGTGNINVQGALSMGSNLLALRTAGNINFVSGGITAGGLQLRDAAAVTTTAGSNAVAVLAASNVGSLDFVNSSALTIGTVGAIGSLASLSGIGASGTVSVATGAGNLTVAQNIATTDTSASAMVLNAGKSVSVAMAASSVGSDTGGNLVISGTSILTTGSNGRVTLYTGSLNNSTGLGTFSDLASGSGHFRYGSDETTTRFSGALGSGMYAVYREQPLLTAAATGQTVVYGTAPSALAANVTGSTVNGDVLSAGDLPTIQVQGAQYSSSGNYKVGSYAVAVMTPVSNAYGYGWSTSGSTLTVTPLALSISGTAVGNQTYNGSATALGVTAGTVTGKVGSDTVNVAASGVFSDKDAGTGKTVTLAYGLSGADAGNYTLVGGSTTASITPKTLTTAWAGVDPFKTYDGTTTASGLAFGALNGLVGSESVTASGVATYADANVGNGKAVTVAYTLANGLNGGKASNYALANQTTSANITPKAVNISVNDDARLFGQSDTAGYAGVRYDGLVNGETPAVFTSQASVTRSNSTQSNAGVYGGVLRASGAAAQNYVFNYVADGTYTIAGANSLLVKVADTSTTYGVTPTYTVTAAQYLKNDLTTVVDLLSNGQVTVAGNNVTVSDSAGGMAALQLTPTHASYSTGGNLQVGNYVLGRTVLAMSNAQNFGNTVTVSGTLTVNQATLGVLANNVGKTYDGGTAMSNLTLGLSGRVGSDTMAVGAAASAYDSKNASNAVNYTISGLSLSGADAANYRLASTTLSGGNGVITPRTLSLSYTGQNKVYDAGTGATVSIGDNRVGGDAVNVAYSAAFADKNVGNGKTVTVSGLALTGTDAGNYSLATTTGYTTANITPATLTLNGASGVDKVYDGTTNLTSGSGYGALVGVLGSDAVSLSGLAAYDGANAGSRTVQRGTLALSGVDANNYTLAWADGSGTINKAPLTVTANADAKFVTQSDNTAYNGVSYSGFVNGEGVSALTGTLAMARSNAGTDAAGTYANVLQASGLSASNYNIAYVAGNYTVVPAGQLLVRVANASAVYGSAPSYTVTSAQYLTIAGNVLTSLNPSSVSGNTYNYNDGAGGTATFTLAPLNASTSGSGNLNTGNYVLNASNVNIGGSNFDSFSLIGNLSVTAKAVTGAASGVVSKTYDGTTAISGAGISGNGLLTGDAVSMTGSGTYASKNAGTGLTYTYTGFGLTGVDAGNYFTSSSSFSGADGAIAARTLSVSYSASDKVYDGTRVASVVSADNRVAGDALTVGLGSTLFASKNVGAQTVNVSGVALSGADSGNYVLASTTGATTATIAPRTLTVGWTAQGKVYDQTHAATVSSTDDRITGDVLSINRTAVFDSANAGLNKNVVVSGISLSGTDSANYVLATATGSANADVTPKTLTLSWTAQDKTYDSTRAATASYGGSSVYAGDTVAVGWTALFADANASASAKTVGITNITLSGASAGNYTLATTSGSATAMINPKLLSLSASKTYDGTSSLTGAVSLSGLIGPETLTYSGATASDMHVASAGKFINAITLSDGAQGELASNYQLPVLDASHAPVNITPRALSVTASIGGALSKVYDGSTAASAAHVQASIGGAANGDELTTDTGGVSLAYNSAHVASATRIVAHGSVGFAVSSGVGEVSDYAFTKPTVADVAATIVPKPLTVSGVLALDKTYDGSVTANISNWGSLQGVLAGESLTLLHGSASFSDANAGVGKVVTASGYALADGMGVASDYQLVSTSATAMANIQQTAAVVTHDARFLPLATTHVYQGERRTSMSEGLESDPHTQMVAVSLPKDAAITGQGFTIDLSRDAHALVVDETPLRVALPDGRPLPSWLKFDAQALSLTLGAVPLQALPIEVLLTSERGRVLLVISERKH